MTSLAGITLTDHTIWIDEFNDSPVAQSVEFTRGGRQIIYSSGKSIDQSMAIESHYNPRSTVVLIDALKKQPGLSMSLVLPNARTFQVVFAHETSPVMTAEPEIKKRTKPQNTDLYTITLKLRVI